MSDEPTPVVTVFLVRGDRVLLCQRSEEVRTYRGRWAGISGYLEETDPLERARRELREETGLDPSQLRLLARSDPHPVDDPDEDRHWLVYPFRFEVPENYSVRLDREHRRCRWVEPPALDELPTVPGLREVWETVS